MIEELEVVALTVDLPALGLAQGDIGTVVLVHEAGAALEVEFVTVTGETIAVETLAPHQLRQLSRRAVVIPSAREGSGRARASVPQSTCAEGRGLASAPRRDDVLVSVERARELRKTMTKAEVILWQRLRTDGLGARVRRQELCGPYVLDFVCRAARLVVEVDGSQNAGSTRDLKSDAALAADGYRVLRFWDNEVGHREPGWRARGDQGGN